MTMKKKQSNPVASCYTLSVHTGGRLLVTYKGLDPKDVVRVPKPPATILYMYHSGGNHSKHIPTKLRITYDITRMRVYLAVFFANDSWHQKGDHPAVGMSVLHIAQVLLSQFFGVDPFELLMECDTDAS